VLLITSLVLVAVVSAQEATPEATPAPRPDFTLEPDATLDPSLVYVTPLQDTTVVNVRRGPGLQFPVRGLLRPNRYLEAIGTNGFDVERPCSESLQNDLDMWIMVVFNEGEAWVARCVVEVEGDLSLLPVMVAAESTAEATVEAPAAPQEPVATQES
jgi:hypothetical protein